MDFEDFDDIPQTVNRRARCRDCQFLNWNFLTNEIEDDGNGHFCGLHGGASVDPDGMQLNLDHKGACGFSSKNRQLSLFD